MKHDRDFTQTKPVNCPCCSQPVEHPTFEVLRDACGLVNQEAYVLEAIMFGPRWNAELWPNRKPWPGLVFPVTFFDSLYRNDEDGGPSEIRMKRQLKWVVFHLKNKLEGSGVGVESGGYGGGYRLVIVGADRNAA